MALHTKNITHGELKDGMVIYNHGHQFTVKNVSEPLPGIIRYTGICTASRRNDSIRHSAYNGGTYGASADIRATIVEPGYEDWAVEEMDEEANAETL
jgi:hypothetical protein